MASERVYLLASQWTLDGGHRAAVVPLSNLRVESGEGVWEEGLLMWHTHPTGNGVCLVLPGGAGSGEGADDV